MHVDGEGKRRRRRKRKLSIIVCLHNPPPLRNLNLYTYDTKAIVMQPNRTNVTIMGAFPYRTPPLLNAVGLVLFAVGCFYMGSLWDSNIGLRPRDLALCGLHFSEPSDVYVRIPENGGLTVDVFEENMKVKEWGINGNKVEVCNPMMKDYVPCHDYTDHAVDRHCPSEERLWFCVVPTPKSYKRPIPWPQSKSEVWYSNIPSKRLLVDNESEKWISLDNDKFRFLDDGESISGEGSKLLKQISNMAPAIKFGATVRLILALGNAFSSFDTSLFPSDVITLIVGPKDSPENIIQLSLERGLPAMILAFGTHRLPYPSQAFDFIHCTKCSLNWTCDGGVLLLEANRMLRAGGYFAWSGKFDDNNKLTSEGALRDLKDLTMRICWRLVNESEGITIWEKTSNVSCYLNRDPKIEPPLCDINDDPNDIWYVSLKACLSYLPRNGLLENSAKWPQRLHTPPDSLKNIESVAYISRQEMFATEAKYWKIVVRSYLSAFSWKSENIRNVMDMNANFGGFAAALAEDHVDCWVMNVVPVSRQNTLPVIYGRGLLGVAHDWCEPFDTFPRTYDLIHTSGLFIIEKSRCSLAYIILEMDRILRPGGHAVIEDSLAVLVETEALAKAVGWRTTIIEIADEKYGNRNVLYSQKQYLVN